MPRDIKVLVAVSKPNLLHLNPGFSSPSSLLDELAFESKCQIYPGCPFNRLEQVSLSSVIFKPKAGCFKHRGLSREGKDHVSWCASFVWMSSLTYARMWLASTVFSKFHRIKCDGGRSIICVDRAASVSMLPVAVPAAQVQPQNSRTGIYFAPRHVFQNFNVHDRLRNVHGPAAQARPRYSKSRTSRERRRNAF